MDKLIPLIEFKSPDQLKTVNDLVRIEFKKAEIPEEKWCKDYWAVYSNDRLVTNWSKKIRPRSKMVLANKEVEKPSLNFVYENNEIIVVDKKAGLPTQKTLKNFEDNLYDQVRFYYLKEKSFPPGLPYVGLHHRLDRGTSGLVLMTKQRSANKDVADLFKDRRIQKEYLAYTEFGESAPAKRWLQEDKIKRGPASKVKFFFQVDKEGDQAITQFELLESKQDKFHKILCRPKTGRTHQLRVQLSHKGYPILGDPVYGQKKTAKRMMLHAYALSFPFRKQKIEVKSEPDWQEPNFK